MCHESLIYIYNCHVSLVRPTNICQTSMTFCPACLQTAMPCACVTDDASPKGSPGPTAIVKFGGGMELLGRFEFITVVLSYLPIMGFCSWSVNIVGVCQIRNNLFQGAAYFQSTQSLWCVHFELATDSKDKKSSFHVLVVYVIHCHNIK